MTTYKNCSIKDPQKYICNSIDKAWCYEGCMHRKPHERYCLFVGSLSKDDPRIVPAKPWLCTDWNPCGNQMSRFVRCIKVRP